MTGVDSESWECCRCGARFIGDRPERNVCVQCVRLLLKAARR